MDTFLVRSAPSASPVRVRRRLTEEAGAQILLSLEEGRVLIATFDHAHRDRVRRWPGILLVGGIRFVGRRVRRLRFDQDGRPLPPPNDAADTPTP
jgi:hypothetical protein